MDSRKERRKEERGRKKESITWHNLDRAVIGSYLVESFETVHPLSLLLVAGLLSRPVANLSSSDLHRRRIQIPYYIYIETIWSIYIDRERIAIVLLMF